MKCALNPSPRLGARTDSVCALDKGCSNGQGRLMILSLIVVRVGVGNCVCRLLCLRVLLRSRFCSYWNLLGYCDAL